MSGVIRYRGDLSIDALVRMSPMLHGVDMVEKEARKLLIQLLKSQPSVQKIFYGNDAVPRFDFWMPETHFDLDRYAILYTCDAICNLKDDYRIHHMLHGGIIRELRAEMHSGLEWKKLGFALYANVFINQVRDPVTGQTFGQFLHQGGEEWARNLAIKVREKKYVYSVIRPILTGCTTEAEYNRDMNVLFLKLQLLDPQMVAPTYNYLRRAFPNLNLELVTRNYLGEPLDWKLIKAEVEKALNRLTYPKSASMISLDKLDVFHGVDVIEFILIHARDLRLWTGQYPDNIRISRPSDRCILL